MAAPQAQPTRVCPHCATVAQTAAATCPWCRRSYRRRLWPALLVSALVMAVLIVGGFALLLNALDQDIDARFDDAVQEVQGQIDRDVDDAVDRLQTQVQRELDARLPSSATP